MDPQRALHSLVTELARTEPDRNIIEVLLNGLNDWVSHEGFLPKVTRCKPFYEGDDGRFLIYKEIKSYA